MKVAYAISFEDFLTVQPHFVARPGHNAGFKGVLAVCLLMVALGFFCILRGLGISTGTFLIGLGICSAAVAYFYDKRSVGKIKDKYFRNCAVAYQRIHCRDQRTLELGQNGFTVTCNCGSVTRPWTELVRFSENESVFIVGTKRDAQLVPKTAFSSAGATTEFRALLLERLDADRPIPSRSIKFSYIPRDFRDAQLLHLLHAGGWRHFAKTWTTYCIAAYGAYVIWRYVSPQGDRAILCGLIGAVLGVPLLRAMRAKRKHYLAPQQIYFSEQGLHLQDSATVARNAWTEFVGYLESDHIFLLYYNPRLYRIIPRRAFEGREAEFRRLLEANLGKFDYKRTAPLPAKTQDMPQSNPST
jgi:YcxB-like protein